MALRLEDDLGFLLARAHRAMRRWLMARLDFLGVTYEQFVVLAYLWQEANISQSELAQRTFMDKTSLARMLHRMENAGLLFRTPDASDARVNRVHLTSLGRDLQGKIGPLRSEGLQKATQSLSKEEVKGLKRLLNHIYGNMTL
jgi:DNA-binding MarR family transcriptional regulator